MFITIVNFTVNLIAKDHQILIKAALLVELIFLATST